MSFVKGRQSEFTLCLGLGLLGAAAVLVAGGLTWLAAVLAGLLLAAGVLLGRKMMAMRHAPGHRTRHCRLPGGPGAVW